MCGGGFVKSVWQATVERPIRAVRHNPVNILHAAVGIATGNPWLAGAAGAGVGAMNGGIGGAVKGGLGAGIGTWMGSAGGLSTAQSLPALAIGKTAYVAGMTGLGTAIGNSMASQLSAPVLPSGQAPNGAPINIPSFEQLQRNAVVNTQRAFDREGVYHLLNPFKRFNSQIQPWERDNYPSLKKTAKSRIKKMT
ncbi:MAG: hypothetical protein IJ730_02575 [Alphaproteobacteria bacterium]|nr:hypothetical protein [Alphaproteobacteria bacterium]